MGVGGGIRREAPKCYCEFMTEVHDHLELEDFDPDEAEFVPELPGEQEDPENQKDPDNQDDNQQG